MQDHASKGSVDWIIWAAWADRITFEEIYKICGKTEHEVICIMRKRLKPNSFRTWRARASQISHKHKSSFVQSGKIIDSGATNTSLHLRSSFHLSAEIKELQKTQTP